LINAISYFGLPAGGYFDEDDHIGSLPGSSPQRNLNVIPDTSDRAQASIIIVTPILKVIPDSSDRHLRGKVRSARKLLGSSSITQLSVALQ